MDRTPGRRGGLPVTEQADVVVIGSGVAGAFSAWRLAARGLRVLVLEAGPRIERGDIVVGFSSSPRFSLTAGCPNPSWAPRPEWGAGDDSYIVQKGSVVVAFDYLRVLGGTTWHWNAGADRLLPADYRTKSTFGVGEDWPISYQDIEPYYVEAEREMGVSGGEGRNSPRSEPYPMPVLPLSYADQTISARLRPIRLSVAHRPSARHSLPYDGRPQCD